MKNRSVRMFLLALLCALLALSLTGAPALADGIDCTDLANAMEWSKSDELPSSGGPYVLTTDVRMVQPWTLNSSMSLCLNGHKITFTVGSVWAGTDGDRNPIDLRNGSTLSIYDHTGKGSIVGAPEKPVVYIENGVFNLYGGTVTGGSTGVYLNRKSGSCAFHMFGGTVTGNNGVDGSGTLVRNYGGVYVGNGELTISGTAKVLGNHRVVQNTRTPANITLMGTAVIRVSGPLSWNGSAMFGVTADKSPADGEVCVITSGLPENGTHLLFECDRPGGNLIAGMNDAGEAVIGWKAAITFAPGGAGGEMESVQAVKGGAYTLPYPYSLTAPRERCLKAGP